ncbi:hypothetical protein BJ138DRAFT_983955, partial [Hygrophoropsis aurantiaca]
MVSRARSTRISYLFSEKNGRGGDSAASQGFVKGNVAILPQDSVKLRDIIPPDRDEIQQAMCALFVGSDTRATRENIAKLRPVLVSKKIVRTLVNFLVENNRWYRSQNVRVSESNIDDLYDGDGDFGVPRAVELCFLPDERPANASASADYTDRGENLQRGEGDPFLLESVGYTDGDHSPVNYRLMKATALARCLDRTRYVQMRSGTRLIDDRDPGLLTWLFPHLDPFGIGGFHNPDRNEDQRISFGRQVLNLLSRDGPFEADPNFAYVCFNIIQRQQLNQDISFRVKSSQRYSIGRELYECGPVLTDLIRKWQTDVHAGANNAREKRALFILNQLKYAAKHVKGSTGYKLCRRNEIR